jgi:hypothetical protein
VRLAENDVFDDYDLSFPFAVMLCIVDAVLNHQINLIRTPFEQLRIPLSDKADTSTFAAAIIIVMTLPS